MKYILNGHQPVKENDIFKWGKWYESADRKVAETFVGNVQVSTVFLGLDHAWGGGEPILFETMIFGGKEDGFQQRYHTWEEAEVGHEEAVELAKE
jgi:hypothetical protein